MGAQLRRFLARLSVDPELLSEFIKDPSGLIAKAGLSDGERMALTSRDQLWIQASVVEDLAATPTVSQPAGASGGARPG